MAFPPEPLKFDLYDALDTVSGLDRPFDVIFERGDFTLECYSPVGADLQTRHDRDEIYIVARGRAVSAATMNERTSKPATRCTCQPGRSTGSKRSATILRAG